jgi:tripartite-type tricarboxylate transporter receptor subunit TctC
MNDSKYKTLDQLMTVARAKPGTIVLGMNIGGVGHIAARLMEEAYPGAKFRLANVGGAANQFSAILGGHVEVNPFSSADFSRFQPKGLRALAYAAEKRHPNFPNIATTAELGHPSIKFCFGQMWYAPKGTPKDRTAVMANALEKAFNTPLVQKRWAELAMTPNFLKGEAFRKRIAADVAMIKRVFAK